MSIEPLIRPKQMARRLVDGGGASFDTIYRWILGQIKIGTIPSYRLNGVEHVRASEVECRLQAVMKGNENE